MVSEKREETKEAILTFARGVGMLLAGLKLELIRDCGLSPQKADEICIAALKTQTEAVEDLEKQAARIWGPHNDEAKE